MQPTVLIADSDPQLCDLYAMSLADYGYEVETATDGLNCLDKLRELTPAVLLLDCALPWGGGDGILAWLREEWAGPEVSVVLTSWTDPPPNGAADLDPPTVQFLPKPFGMNSLLESVRSILARDGREEAISSFRSVAGD